MRNWSNLLRVSRFTVLVLGLLAVIGLSVTLPAPAQALPPGVGFGSSGLAGAGGINNPTSIEFGPDGRLYVTQQDGTIWVFQVVRNGPNDYAVTDTEVINLVKEIQNYNDDGTFFNGLTKRQVTGILVRGTVDNPVLYVGSSDYRIGGGGSGADTGLDTNSGMISRLTWVGADRDDPTGYWDHVELIRGLPRSEENHANNGMQLDEATNTLYIASGGSANAGAPSNNFAFITEYALAGAILSVDLDMIEAMPIQEAVINGQVRRWVYDIPTTDDPSRPNLNGIDDPSDPGYDGIDPNDPFGGNDGLNQGKVVPGEPVQVYSPGYRNAYDLVIRQDGKMYVVDNGANKGWGGFPELEGTPNCTNNWLPGEPGSNSVGPPPNFNPAVNNLDNLHYVTGQGFYGGHPVPIRGNPAGAGLFTHETGGGADGTFRTTILPYNDPNYATQSLPPDWPPYPVSQANPVECDFLQPGVDDGALETYVASTNGIDEYTASNFSGAIQGDLLLASFDGVIYLAELNAAGTGLDAPKSQFASGFGSIPLDLTAQGDSEIFGGTVWAVTYGADNVTVFEPNDYDGNSVPCVGTDDDTIDEDGDGYTNADEIANGTNPCSSSSRPDDFDAADGPEFGPFLRSNLLDNDDDNDTLLDTYDPFAWDASNGAGTSLPISYPLLNGDPGFGFFGLGFTGLMTNGTPTVPGTDYLNMIDFVDIIAGGAVGLLTVPAQGTMLDGTNDLTHAFQFGLDVAPGQGTFVIETQINAPFFDDQPLAPDDIQGLYIGSGDQDNYILFALVDGGFAVIVENGGVSSRTDFPLPALFEPGGEVSGTISNIQMVMEVDPLTSTLMVGYALNGSGPINYLGSPTAITGDTLAALNGTHTVGGINTKLAIGGLATNSGAPYGGTFDYFNVTPAVSDATALFEVNTGGLNSSTYNGGIEITNTSTGGATIERVTIDMTTNVLPDIVYDPDGTAGDTVARDFLPQDNAGFVQNHAFSVLDSSGFGWYVLDIEFDGFIPGEMFSFALDIDPISIQGAAAPGPGESGSVSGLEMAGATITVEYSTGEIQTAQLYRKDLVTVGDASVVVQNVLPPTPSIEVLNVPGTPVTVYDPAQTVRITGTPGETVGLLIFEGAMWTAGLPGGGVNVDPYDANSIVAVQEIETVIGPAGTVDVPIVLTNQDGTSETGIAYITAVTKDMGATSNLSNVAVVHFDPSSAPATSFYVNAGGPQVVDTNTWTIDSAGNQVYSTGGTVSTGGALTTNNTSAPDAVFAQERYGDVDYNFPVDPGLYTVTLYLMEGWNGAFSPGVRVFDVSLEGSVPAAFDNIDIFSQAGGGNIAIAISADVNVIDGNLDLDLLPIVQNPAVRAISVVPKGVTLPANLEIRNAGGTPISTLNFFSTPEGTTSAPQTVSLNNMGDSDSINVTSIALSGPDAADFAVTPTTPLTLLPSGASNLDITFSPSRIGLHTATLTITHDGVNGPTTTLTLTGEGVAAAAGAALFRINVGGPQLIAADASSPDWSADDAANPSPYRTSGGPNIYTAAAGNAHPGPIVMTHPTLALAPAAPQALFETERWDPDGGTPYAFAFPVAPGTNVSVRLYFAELFSGVDMTGERVMDVFVEGSVPTSFDNIDQIATAGPKGAFMLSTQLTVNDGTLNIELDGVTENAALKGIEIIEVGAPNTAPNVTNPGDQNNTAGDPVTLPIAVTEPDGDNITCAAVNLPDGLSINPTTCEITGTATNQCVGGGMLIGGGGAIQEQGGMVVIEPEFASPVADWSVQNAVPGAIGGNYYEWKVGDPAMGVDPAGSGTMSYAVAISNPGIYRFQMRSAAPNNTEHNDMWMRFTDSDAFFSVADENGFPDTSDPAQPGYDGIGVNTWVKVYQNQGANNWTWETDTVDFDPHFIYVEFDNPGTYTMQISGRSTMFKLDRMVLWQEAVGFDTATDINNPPSPQDSGSTCEYAVSITVTDDGTPAESTTINFTWTIDIPAGNSSPVVDPISDQAVLETDTLNVAINATDADSDPLTLSIAIVDASLNPVDPTWYTFTDNGNGTANLAFTPPVGSAGVYTATVTADDGTTTSTQSFDITVNTAANNLPSITNIADQTVAEGGNLVVPVTATDLDADPLALSIAIVDASLNPVDPGWFVFADNGDGTGSLNFNPPVGSAAVYTATVTVDDGGGLPVTETFTITVTPSGTVRGTPLFRINVGGPQLPAADATTPDWSVDTAANPSPYRSTPGGNSFYNAGSGSAHPGPIVMTHPSLTAAPAAPAALFETERFDPPTGDELEWDFPVTNGSRYAVRLYFAELFSGITAPGQRLFDVSVEGSVPAVFDDIDQFATAGAKGAFMLSYELTMTDNVLDINFIHGALDNPALKGIEIVALLPPTLDPIADQAVLEGATLPVAVTANDPDGDPVALTVQVQDSGANVIPQGAFYTFVDNGDGTGTITFTPAIGDVDTYDVTVTASNIKGSDTETFVLNVQPGTGNAAPVVQSIAPQTVQVEDVLAVPVTASDLDSDPLTLSVEVQDSGANVIPQGAFYTFVDNGDGTGNLNFTPAIGEDDTYTVTITADDGTDTGTGSFTLTVTPNNPPAITPIPAQLAYETLTLNVPVTATDADGDPITLAVTVEDSGANVIPQGAFYTFVDNGDGTGAFTFTPALGEADTYTVTVGADDGNDVSIATFALNVVAIPADPPSALLQVNPTGTLDASTYNTGSFILENTSANPTNQITGLLIDLRTTSLPDLIFDPLAMGGDLQGKCLTPDTGETAVGYVVPPGGNCAVDPTPGGAMPFSGAHGGGYDIMSMSFNDFDPGETFTFSVDIDPNSIQGGGAIGDAGSISGLELVGATVVVAFSDGTTYTTELYTIPTANPSGSQTVMNATTPIGTLTLDVQGITLTPEGTADTDVANQTMVINGPAGATVSLTHMDSRLHFTNVPACGYDVQNYDANEVMDIFEYTVTLDGSGQALVPVTLVQTLSGDPAFPDGGLNYFTATIVDGSVPRQNGLTSNTVVLAFPNSNQPPVVVTDFTDQTMAEGAALNLPIEACDIGTDVSPAIQVTIVDQATLTPVAPGFFSVTDNGDGTGALDLTPAAGTAGIYTVTVTADDSALTASKTFTLTVTNVNDAPVIDPIADVTITEGDAPQTVTVTLTDLDGDVPTLTPGALPGFITWDPATNTFTIAPLAGDAGTYPITITADDGNGGTDSVTFNVFVNAAANNAPAIDPIADVTLDEGTTQTVTVTATDADGDPITFTPGALPGFITWDPATDTFTIAPLIGDAGTYPVQVTADDGNTGVDIATFNVTVTPNALPAIDPIADVTLDEGTTQTVTVTATDADGDPITFTPGALPGFITWDPATDTFTIAPLAGDNGTYPVTVTADDGKGGTDSLTFNVIVTVPNSAPIINPITDVNINEGDAPQTVTVTATDANGDPITFTPGTLPGFITWDPATDTFTIAPLAGDAGLYPVSITADDGQGGTNTATFNVIVNTPANNAPVIDPVADVTMTEADTPQTVTVTATDADGDPITFTPGTLPGFITWDPATDTFTIAPLAGDAGTYPVQVTAQDGLGGVDIVTFNVIVNALPNNTPVIDPISSVVMNEGDTPQTVTVTATDADGDPITFTPGALPGFITWDPATDTFTIAPLAGDAGTYPITINADDGQGGVASLTFDVVIGGAANDAPVIDPIADVTLDEGTTQTVTVVVNDPDGDPVTLTPGTLPGFITWDPATDTFTIAPLAGDSAGSPYTVDITADDGNGGVTNLSFNVIAVAPGNNAPVFTPIADVTLDEGATQVVLISATDADGDPITFTPGALPGFITWDPATDTFTIAPLAGDAGTYPLSIEANDGLGGLETLTFNVIVNALAPTPTPTDPPADNQQPQIGVFDPAISKLGLLLPGELGLQGERLEWVIIARNTSNVPGVNVIVSDTLRPELRIDDAVTSKGSVAINGQTVTFTIPQLAPGEAVEMSVFTTVISGGAVVDNTACITANNAAQEECVTALPVTTLPRTGESPWSPIRPLIFMAVMLVTSATGWFGYRRWLTQR